MKNLTNKEKETMEREYERLFTDLMKTMTAFRHDEEKPKESKRLNINLDDLELVEVKVVRPNESI